MIFAVSPVIQKAEVDTYCFGSCQKIKLAGLIDDEFGPFFPCNEENCEFEEGKTPVFGEAFGEDVCVRKLKTVRPKQYPK